MSTHKKRNCLKCNKLFLSNSPGRRICHQCTRINNKIYMPNTINPVSGKTLNGNPIPIPRGPING